MLQWMLDHPEVVAAGSTALLALFAAVQIGLEAWRSRERRKLAANRLTGPAWLARRTLEQSLLQAQKASDAISWAHSVGESKRLDRVEAQMLTVLELGGEAEGKAAKAAGRAFEHFMAYADQVNELAAFKPSGEDGAGGRFMTEDDLERARGMASNALAEVRRVVECLVRLAPRRAHENTLPVAESIGLLKNSRVEV